MSTSVDSSSVDALARLLGAAPEQAAAAAHQAGKEIGATIKTKAQADAPQDRPWLATDGIRKRTWKTRDSSHTDVYTTSDPKGRNVGFHVENGTTDTAPVPFLSSQMVWAEPAYIARVVELLDPFAPASNAIGDDE